MVKRQSKFSERLRRLWQLILILPSYGAFVADVGQPVEGGGSPDGSQTVPVWIIWKPERDALATSWSGLSGNQSETLWLVQEPQVTVEH